METGARLAIGWYGPMDTYVHACLEHASLAAAGRHVLRRCKRHSRTLLPQTRGAATRRDHERLRKRGRQQDGRPEQEARHIHTHGVKRNDPLVRALEGPGYAARRAELRRKAKEAERTRERQAAAAQDEAEENDATRRK